MRHARATCPAGTVESTSVTSPRGGLAPHQHPSDDRERFVSPVTELVAMIGAAAVGALIAVTVIGASLLLAVPAVVVVSGIALVTVRRDRR